MLTHYSLMITYLQNSCRQVALVEVSHHIIKSLYFTSVSDLRLPVLRNHAGIFVGVFLSGKWKVAPDIGSAIDLVLVFISQA